MSEKLKPCPFCGGEAEIVKCDNLFSILYFYVGCKTCLARAKSCYESPEDAVRYWNRRATDEQEFI